VDVRPSRHAFDGGGDVSAGRSYAMAMTGTVKFFNGERGCSDVTLPSNWRTLAPVESIIGVLMCGI